MSDAATGLEIAIVGLACRVPGARSAREFWTRLRSGFDGISLFTDAELLAAGVPAAVFGHPDYVRAAGVLGDPTRFDADFFGYSPRDAQILDPQQRVFLETAWEALEDAGRDPRAGGSVGVYAGGSLNNYLQRVTQHPEIRGVVSTYQMMIGADKDFLATRVAYKLGLDGPAVVVQSACSTSLAAVHLACQGLLAGECDMALAGGASVFLPEAVGYVYQTEGIRSRDGRTRTFDAAATGTVRSNGVGVVVLKRLADALRDRDRIAAVIRGSAMNNDGSRKVGFTAPSVEGQTKVVSQALALADVEASSVSYVEAHGTATPLGDPIEVAALTRVFRASTEARGFCGLGSVKSNLGHLDAAAGVAGLIKTALMLEHRELVPSLHFERPNPKLELESSPFYVTTRHAPWNASAPLRAGVSSFGIGGTNVHVVLQEAPARTPRASRPGSQLFALSARTASALQAASLRLASHLEGAGDAAGDVAFTLRQGRTPLAQRRAIVAATAPDAAAQLRVPAPAAVASPLRVVFLFPGTASGSRDMGRELYATQPTVREEIDACAAAAAPTLGLDLREAFREAAREIVWEPRVERAALLALELGLAALWKSWGVVPEAVLGQGIGVHAAASSSGALSREEALRRAIAGGPEAPLEDGLAALLAGDPCAFVEVGPGESLVGLVRASRHDAVAVASLPSVLEAAARLWTAGVDVDWTRDVEAARVSLPTYPFEGDRHVVEFVAAASPALVAPVSGAVVRVPVWKAAPLPAARPLAGRRFCVFEAAGADLAESLRRAGATVEAVGPEATESVEALVARLAAGTEFVHAFGAASDATWALAVTSPAELLQALGRSGRKASVCLVARHAQDIAGDETLDAARVVASGLAGAPGSLVSVRHVDVTGIEDARLATVMAAELGSEAGEAWVGYRGHRRWARHEGDAPPARPGVWREGGAFVVVGGSSPVGGEIADALGARSEAGFGPVDGAAYVAETGWASPAGLEALCARVVADVEALERRLEDRPVAFVLLVAPQAGPVARRLDALAWQRRREGRGPWLSAQWTAGAGPDAAEALARLLAAAEPGATVAFPGTRAVARRPRPALATAYAAPETALEKALAERWGALLGVDAVGVNDDFFELGGDSLRAAELVTALRAEYPAAERGAAALVESPTIRGLARALDASGRGATLDRSAVRGQRRKELMEAKRRSADAPVERGN